MTEYTVVLGLVVVALVISALDPSPLEALAAALRRAYQGFSYVISFAAQDPLSCRTHHTTRETGTPMATSHNIAARLTSPAAL